MDTKIRMRRPGKIEDKYLTRNKRHRVANSRTIIKIKVYSANFVGVANPCHLTQPFCVTTINQYPFADISQERLCNRNNLSVDRDNDVSTGEEKRLKVGNQTSTFTSTFQTYRKYTIEFRTRSSQYAPNATFDRVFQLSLENQNLLERGRTIWTRTQHFQTQKFIPILNESRVCLLSTISFICIITC